MKIIIAFLALASTTLLGQTVNVTDNSLPNAPIAISGTATFDSTNPTVVTCTLTGKNKSTKSVMFIAVNLTVVGPTGQMQVHQWTHDHYWAPSTTMLASPQGQMTVNEDPNCDIAVNNPKAEPTTPSATAQLVFVQFDDGAYWSNGKEGNNLAKRFINVGRVAEAKYLTTLYDAYTTGGLQGLSNALAVTQTEIRCINRRQGYLEIAATSAGMSEVAAKLAATIANIQPRSSFLTVNVP